MLSLEKRYLVKKGAALDIGLWGIWLDQQLVV
jgi:hypothetical protein